jgi:hypothetical protein
MFSLPSECFLRQVFLLSVSKKYRQETLLSKVESEPLVTIGLFAV